LTAQWGGDSFKIIITCAMHTNENVRAFTFSALLRNRLTHLGECGELSNDNKSRRERELVSLLTIYVPRAFVRISISRAFKKLIFETFPTRD
jgi:hypothetical protein